jgi:hypothetical protein
LVLVPANFFIVLGLYKNRPVLVLVPAIFFFIVFGPCKNFCFWK